MTDLPWPHAGCRVHHLGLGDRPDPRASPNAPRARHTAGRGAPIDAAPPRRPDRPLSTAPSPRHHAGTCGVGGSPTGASDGAPPASPPPTGTAVRAAHETRERGGGHAAARRSVLAGRRSCRIRDRPQSNFLSRAGEYAGFVVSGRRAVTRRGHGVIQRIRRTEWNQCRNGCDQRPALLQQQPQRSSTGHRIVRLS